ncbi:MAG: hypothetical protein KJ058_16210 [Thermoanaerobaculia bacterium]|nr:hypothetical protein [Thermoanaerobaculia bacterium]MCZ7651793.1 hypothetical protein [Thermoanaerobaculia bacterium]
MRRPRTAPLPLRPLLLAAALLPGLALPAAGAEFSFSRFNRSYQDLVSEAPPYQAGGLVLRLRSPSQTLILQSHLLALEPAGDGTWKAELIASFLGKGRLVADLDLGGATQRLEDELVVPRQQIELPARVRIERKPDGYRFEALELPASLPVEIRSQLGNGLLALCETASLLSLGGFDCAALERRLQRVDVPLPPPGPGAELFLPLADLTAEERTAFDAFLATGK